MTPHLLWVLNYDVLREQKKFRKPSVFKGCIFEMQGREKRKSKVRYTKIIKDLSAVRCVGTGGSISNAGFS